MPVSTGAGPRAQGRIAHHVCGRSYFQNWHIDPESKSSCLGSIQRQRRFCSWGTQRSRSTMRGWRQVGWADESSKDPPGNAQSCRWKPVPVGQPLSHALYFPSSPASADPGPGGRGLGQGSCPACISPWAGRYRQLR